MMNTYLERLLIPNHVVNAGVACPRSKYLDPFSLKGIFRRAGMHFTKDDKLLLRIKRLDKNQKVYLRNLVGPVYTSK